MHGPVPSLLAAVGAGCLALAAAAADLLIVSPPDLVDAWRYYAAARRAARGQAVEVVDAQTIYAAAETARPDVAVRDFLRAAAVQGTTNVLLGGAWIDADDLDAPVYLLTGERLSLSNAVPGVRRQIAGATSLEAAPSDFPYADLDDDQLADLVVGRFPALPFAYGEGPLLNAAQLVTNYAAKVARGERADFPGRDRLAAAGSTQSVAEDVASTSLGSVRGEMAFFDGVPNIWRPEHPGQVSDSEFVLRETLRTRVYPNWPVAAVESLYHADRPVFNSRYANFSEARTAFLAADSVFSACRAHGNATVALNGGGRLWLTRDLVARATGLSLFADFFVPCRAGMVDLTVVSNNVVYAVPSYGVAAVCSPVGGAVTGVFNSRDGLGGWTTPFALDDGFSTAVATAFVEALFVDGVPRFGDAFRQARRSFVQRHRLSADARFMLEEQLFFGDPTVGLPPKPTGRPLRIVSGTNLVFSAGGGAGLGVCFTGGRPGEVAVVDGDDFYLGGVSNCAVVAVSGGRARLRAWPMAWAPAAVRVTEGTLDLETAETYGDGTDPVAVVTRGTLVWAVSPRAGFANGGERLRRPLVLADATLAVEPAARLHWCEPFALQVSGTSRIETAGAATGGVVRLVGTSTVRLATGAALDLALALADEGCGGLRLVGDGTVRAATGRVLAGRVEVADGAVLELLEVPLPAVTDLVVRAGATLRIPAEPSGRHALVASGCRVDLADGARIETCGGQALTGRVVDGTFYEASSALWWKGGAGVWSDPAGWYDAVTGTYGAWQPGRAAIFDDVAGACVTNDLGTVAVDRLVFATDTVLAGGTVRANQGGVWMPAGVRAELAARLAVAGDLVKQGPGTLALAGVQGDGSQAWRVEGGRLALADVAAPAVTNLQVAAGAFLDLSGRNALTGAVARASLATNALAGAVAPCSLALGVFTPSKPLWVPPGVTLEVVGPIADDGGRTWTATVDGRLDYHGVLSGVYGVLDGAGTIVVDGLRSRSGQGLGFGGCRLVWRADRDGVFPLQGFLARNPAFVVLDGTTVAVPDGGAVAVGAVGAADSCVALYADKNGAFFDIPADSSLVIGAEGSDAVLFGGPGGVVKTGTGPLRFACRDQHTGRTEVRAGTYALGDGTLSRAFTVAAGAELALAGTDPAVLAPTNLVWSAGGCVSVRVRRTGSDLVDLRACAGTVPGVSGPVPSGVAGTDPDGSAVLKVAVAPDAASGFHPLLRVKAGVSCAGVAAVFHGTRGRSARLVRTEDGTLWGLLLGPPGTVLLLR